MEDEFRRGRFVEGAQHGIVEIGALLATHFPRRTDSARNAGDELPDAPVIL
jgi:uncharacterized membrane protein